MPRYSWFCRYNMEKMQKEDIHRLPQTFPEQSASCYVLYIPYTSYWAVFCSFIIFPGALFLPLAGCASLL